MKLTMADKSLKSKNWKTLASILLLDAVMACALMSGDSLKHLFGATPNLPNQLAKSALATSIATIAALFGAFLIPSDVKAMLVFTRFRNVLPGHRAFSNYARHDPRLSVEALEARIGPLPIDPSEQNRLWYSLLKKYEKDPGVADAHQMFLLLRDTSALTFLLCVGLLVVMGLKVIGPSEALRAMAFAGGQLIISIVAARNTGGRLVTNVLAQACLPPPDKKAKKYGCVRLF